MLYIILRERIMIVKYTIKRLSRHDFDVELIELDCDLS